MEDAGLQSASRKRLFSHGGLSSQTQEAAGTQYASNFPAKFEALAQDMEALNLDIIDPNNKKHAQSMVFVAKQLVSQNKLSKAALGKIIVKFHKLPLEFLWMLQSAEIINFSLYAASLSNENLCEIGSRIAKFMDTTNDNLHRNVTAGIAIDFLKTCITLVYGPTPPVILNPVRKSCRILLSEVLKFSLFPLEEESDSVPWWLTQLAKSVPSEIFKNFTESLLEVQLTAPPLISVHQALARQAEWKNGRKSFNVVFQNCDSSTTALNALVKILTLDTKEVNWKAVLIAVSSFLRSYADSKDKMHGLISAWLNQSLSNEDNETLLLSIILARQLSHTCPSAPYASWFKKCFGNRQTTICKSNQHFLFLLNFLTQLVPHEPVTSLKAHHDFPPYVPLSLKEKLQDFLMVASSRLKDLNPTNDNGVFQADKSFASIAEQVQFDIESAISAFQANNKVHERILSASIFKKKYFESYFLPALLTPRNGKMTNDSHSRLVDCLLKAKKISTAQFESFHAKCLERN